MASASAERLDNLRKGVAKVRALRVIIRNAPNQLRRDAAIITFTGTLDAILEDLIALEDAGALSALDDAD
ncbi:hypothetical protein DD563_12890 [Pelagicola sp. LXJ1103]|nr:hypothetical protein DD563_12890 [Pelagicola sp. LXJ1103]